jgi:peptidoglycan/LPS O-acetylase OafA/YrhL
MWLSPSNPQGHQVRKYAFIDALRGYAVLMVITCHTGGMFAGLPYPLKKLTNFGWHGVQLFFLMSCVTLLLSWRADEAKGRASITDFWTRRFFRIAPMYYLAGIFYFLIEPPPHGFDFGQMLATGTFVNAWHPVLIPTVPERWMVVPGGWSIGVEFTFYVVFPLIASRVRSPHRAVMFFVLALALGCAANAIAQPLLQPTYGAIPVANFLYFWFPNQLPIFALGTILYCVILKLWARPEKKIVTLLHRYGTATVFLCVGASATAANIPFPTRLPFKPPLYIPTLLIASLIFMVAVSVLSVAPRPLFVNRMICSLGRVSFSAYLLHFAMLHKLPQVFPAFFDVRASGWPAIFACFSLWVAALGLTYAASWLTFRVIELPSMAVGRQLIEWRRRQGDLAEA